MDNNKNLLDILGILSLVALVYHLLKNLNENTETTVISDNAYNAVQDPQKASELREAVDSYHETGEWDESKLDIIQ